MGFHLQKSCIRETKQGRCNFNHEDLTAPNVNNVKECRNGKTCQKKHKESAFTITKTWGFSKQGIHGLDLNSVLTLFDQVGTRTNSRRIPCPLCGNRPSLSNQGMTCPLCGKEANNSCSRIHCLQCGNTHCKSIQLAHHLCSKHRLGADTVVPASTADIVS